MLHNFIYKDMLCMKYIGIVINAVKYVFIVIQNTQYVMVSLYDFEDTEH